MTTKKPTRRWIAVVGLTLKDGTRIEPGDPVAKPAKWLIEQGKVIDDGV